MVRLDDGAEFVMADLPGLIEGAATGIGLGHRFLRHAERCRVLLHVLDMCPFEERDPIADFKIIQEELRLYRDDFINRPMIIVANKMDLPGTAEKLAELRQALGESYQVWPISALTGEGLQPMLWRVYELLQTAPLLEQAPAVEEVRHTVVRAEAPFIIERDAADIWQVTGQRVERLVAMTDLNNDDAVLRMQRIFIKMGLEDALVEAGVAPGDTVEIAGSQFEYAE
jgi:GTP-binding protein